MKVKISSGKKGIHGLLGEDFKEFCLIDRGSISSVEVGQIWECEIVREITDKKGQKVKIVRPIELHHKCEVWYDGDRPKFTISSGDWYSVSTATPYEERRHVVDKNGLEEYIEITPILKAFCPLCKREVKGEFAKRYEFIRVASIHEVIKLWKSKLPPDFDEAVKEYNRLVMEEQKLKDEFEKYEVKKRNEIYELEKVGKVVVRLTEEERRKWQNGVRRSWENRGGDPFDEPGEPPEYFVKTVDQEAVKRAKQEIRNIESTLKEKEQMLRDKISEMWKEFGKKYSHVVWACGGLIEEEMYNAIYELISKHDPYFHEMTDLRYWHPIEAVAWVFRLYEYYYGKVPNE